MAPLLALAALAAAVAGGLFPASAAGTGSALYERWEAAQIDGEVWAVHTQGTTGNQDPNTGPWAVSSAQSFEGNRSVRHEPDGTHKVLLYSDEAGGQQEDVEYWIAYRFMIPSWADVWANSSHQLYLPGFLLGDGTASTNATGDYLGNLLEVPDGSFPNRGGIWLNGLAPNPLLGFDHLSELTEGVWHEFRVSVRLNSSDGIWYIDEILDGVTVSTDYDYGGYSIAPIGIWWVSRSWNTGGALYIDPLIWSPGEDPGPIDSAGPRCANGADDDADGKIDLADPGCANAQDNSEAPDPPPPPTQCANGTDDDADGKIDLADPGCATAQDDSESPDPLLNQYLPELRLDSQESYWPDSPGVMTDNFAHSNVLTRGGLVELASSTSPDPATRLNLDYIGRTYPSGVDSSEADLIDESDAGRQSDAQLMHDTPGYANKVYGREYEWLDGSKILQYWFFYYYNPKTFTVAQVGEHEGDWEMIQILIAADGTPVSAAYAQHNSAERCMWDRVELNANGHPVVYVAEGSHASYFWRGDHKVFFGPLEVGFDYASGSSPVFPELVDITGFPPPRWIEWPGRWGEDGGSPQGPSFQSKWQNPFSFHNGLWSCTEPSSQSNFQRGSNATALAKPLPPIISAHRVGRNVVIRYRLKRSPGHAEPWLLVTTLDSKSDRFTPTNKRTVVKGKTAGRVVQPILLARGRLVIRASVRAENGLRSGIVVVGVRG